MKLFSATSNLDDAANKDRAMETLATTLASLQRWSIPCGIRIAQLVPLSIIYGNDLDHSRLRMPKWNIGWVEARWEHLGSPNEMQTVVAWETSKRFKSSPTKQSWRTGAPQLFFRTQKTQ